MAAFRECGIDHVPIIIVSEHAVIAKTEEMPWDDATAAVIVQLLRNCNQADSFEFEGILLVHQMLQQSAFRSKTSTVFVFSNGDTGNVPLNDLTIRENKGCHSTEFRIFRFAQSIASLNLASLRLECLCVPVINRFARITISFSGSGAVTFAMLERDTTMPKRNATHGIEGALLFHQKMDQICYCLRIQAFGLVRRDLIYAQVWT
jgi:hypothetical protein